MKIAIVTGASSGMGREFVRQIPDYCSTLDEIWVIARRGKRLEALQNETTLSLRILEGDLLSDDFFDMFQNLLKTERPDVRVLVNSAGIGRNGSVKKIAEKEDGIQCRMVDLNCRTIVKVTQAVLPYLSEESHILNLASGSAFCPQPYFTVYAATKAFVLSFSRGLNGELRKEKIRVTAVCPGPVKTEFFEQDGMKPAEWKKPFMARPDRVVCKALKDAHKNRSVSVYGCSMKVMHLISKILPQAWILAATEKLSFDQRKQEKYK